MLNPNVLKSESGSSLSLSLSCLPSWRDVICVGAWRSALNSINYRSMLEIGGSTHLQYRVLLKKTALHACLYIVIAVQARARPASILFGGLTAEHNHIPMEKFIQFFCSPFLPSLCASVFPDVYFVNAPTTP